ncbi:unnamed protein product [Trichogramma brassicae]|uniref:CUB domain-containing protein n=1 Tax=Trichogramma brassicae TaxID=86971 RepID=A0A6H5IVR8_9HYME|nr:unnamed protein product [Trichogramma brassicae]
MRGRRYACAAAAACTRREARGERACEMRLLGWEKPRRSEPPSSHMRFALIFDAVDSASTSRPRCIDEASPESDRKTIRCHQRSDMIWRHFLYLLLLFQLCIETYQWPFSYWWSGTSSKSQLPVHKAISAAANSLFPRVLNFFPEPVAEDCISSDKRRRGVCMNTYDCQERRGHASGSCALGFGTCCICSMTSRMWEMSVQQLGFEQRAPAGCLQYARSANGTLRTLNYLPNGRYLANYDYLICVRQEYGMCSIAYEPCGRDSFRIGSSRRLRNATTLQQITTEAPSIFDFDYEGSGASAEQQFSAVGSSDGSATKKCRDRILIPCDFEEFITPGNDGTGICDLEHCGISFCPMTTSATTTRQRPQTTSGENGPNCRVETSALPFHIRVDFGPAGVETAATPPEDMTGMCLSYEQIPCAS